MSEKSHGGKREGAGAKRKADIEKTDAIFLTMIKEVKNVESDEQARIELAKELFTFERGCMFIAEHVFGKPKEIIEQTTFNLAPIFGENPLDNKE